MAKYDYNYGYKRGKDWMSRALDRVESLPDDVFEGGAVSDRAKRRLFEQGLHGRATVLKAPGKHRVSEIQENVGTFRVRIEVEGCAPYEAKVKQSFAYAEWTRLQEGAQVDCRVDPEKPNRAMLMVFEGEFEQPEPQLHSAAATVAAGKPAIATVISSELYGQKAPGTEDEIYVIELELRSEEQRKP